MSTDKLNGTSLVNDNYEKILDIISQEITSDKDVKRNRAEVIKLLEMDEERINTFIDSYGIFWNNLPKIVYEVKNVREFNIVVNHFAQYIDMIDKTVKDRLNDHGYTILVLYYLKIGKIYLESNV